MFNLLYSTLTNDLSIKILMETFQHILISFRFTSSEKKKKKRRNHSFKCTFLLILKLCAFLPKNNISEHIVYVLKLTS